MSSRQVARLQTYVETLKAQLVANDIAPLDPAPHWSEKLTEQERLLVQVLVKAYPDSVDLHALDERLARKTGRERTTPESLRTVIHHIRKALGQGAIEAIHSVGYRAGPLVLPKGGG